MRETLVQGERSEKLPKELDRPGSLFAYGALLDKGFLSVATGVPEERIHITESQEEAQEKSVQHPNDLVIFIGVTLRGVRTTVFNESEMDRHLGDKREKVYKHVAESTGAEDGEESLPQDNIYLMTRRVVDSQSLRFVNGGLVLGLTPAQLERIDVMEFAMDSIGKGEDEEAFNKLYERVPVEDLSINGVNYTPEHIQFYEGKIPEDKFHDERGDKKTWRLLRESIMRMSAAANSLLDSKTEEELSEKKEALSRELENSQSKLYWPSGIRGGDVRTKYKELLLLDLSDIIKVRALKKK